MTRSRSRAVAFMLGIVASPAAAPAAAQSTGGAQAPGETKIERLVCVATAAQPCPSKESFAPGAIARVGGEALHETRSLLFRGKRGAADDVSAPARHVRAGHFEAIVPTPAKSGPIDVIGEAGGKTASSAIRILPSAPAPAGPGDVFYADGAVKPSVAFQAPRPESVEVRVVRVDDQSIVRAWNVTAVAGANQAAWNGQTAAGPAPSGRYRFEIGADAQAATLDPATAGEFTLLDHLFPIRGKHDLGQSDTNSFGGGRGHQGQDMFAGCGTPVAAARGGRVRFAGFHAAAGNYAVITSKRTGLDYVYMHMRSTPLVTKGQRVTTGQPVGEVGDTGRASGCHLHFELWSKPGWYTGGAAFDPLPRLQAWDAWS